MVEVAVEVLRRVQATRFVEPLREGGSLPGLVEADDLGTYVVKFTGAGQGHKALVSEIVVGELGRRLGNPRPGAGADRDRSGHRTPGGRPGGAAAPAREPRHEPRDRLPAGIDRLRRHQLAANARGRRRGDLARRASPSTSTGAGATRTYWSGIARCGRSTTVPRCCSSTRGPASRPSRRRPYPLDEHALAPFAGVGPRGCGGAWHHW